MLISTVYKLPQVILIKCVARRMQQPPVAYHVVPSRGLFGFTTGSPRLNCGFIINDVIIANSHFLGGAMVSGSNTRAMEPIRIGKKHSRTQ